MILLIYFQKRHASRNRKQFSDCLGLRMKTVMLSVRKMF